MKVDASHEYNREGNLPVDVAGFMKRQAVVECICEGLSKRILNEANQTAGSVFQEVDGEANKDEPGFRSMTTMKMH